MSPIDALRDRIEKKTFTLCCGAWDPMSAKIVEKVGFDVVTLQSGILYSVRGYVPDMGALCPTDVRELAYRVTGAVKIPCMLDLEGGAYGENPITLLHWLREFERAGAAWVYVEDAEHRSPTADRNSKGSWQFGMGELATAEKTAEKINTLVKARRSNIVIGARTQTFRNDNIDEIIKRLKIYKEAGADILHLVAIKDRETLRRFRHELDGPLCVQATPPSFFPSQDARNRSGDYLTATAFEELRSEGVQFYIFPRAVSITYKALWDGLSQIISSRRVETVASDMMTRDFELSLLDYNEAQ
jgi:2-methylisocitrate lyase-like PEP mutase family enzyme